MNLENIFKFYRRFFVLAAPVIFQDFVMQALNIIDNIMIGGLGGVYIAGVGLANQICFIFLVCIFGVCSAASAFTAQYWGAKDIAGIRRVLIMSLVWSELIAFFFVIMSVFVPNVLISVFTNDPDVIKIGSDYLRTISPNFIVSAAIMPISHNLRATENAKISMLCSICALVFNTLLNYFVIYGRSGFPALGANGAAISTVSAQVLELGLILVIVYRKNLIQAIKLKEIMVLANISSEFSRDFLKRACPVLINEIFWVLGSTGYLWVIGHISTDDLSAIEIAKTIENLSFVLFGGAASAAVVIVAKSIGEGQEDLAFIYAKRIFFLSFVASILVGLVVFLSTDLILLPYNISPSIKFSARSLIYAGSILLTFRSTSAVNILGILRSGGDNTFAALADVLPVWLIGIPILYITGAEFKLPIFWAYLSLFLEELVRFVITTNRFLKKKWINNLMKGT